MPASRTSNALPPWVMPLAVVGGILLIVFIAWKALSGSSPPTVDTAKEVHPGMYDFRAEAQKGNLGRRSTGQGDNPQ